MYTIYQTLPGDTIESLALKFKINAEELRKLNNLPFNYQFRIGEQIVIKEKENNNSKDYIIKEGDTAYSIAVKNGVSLASLLDLNGLNENEYIYPGEMIKIPNSKTDRYLTEEGDTLYKVSNKLNTDINSLIENNENIYLKTGQLINNSTYYM